MSLVQMIVRRCTQDAVYWGDPKEDGSGGKTFSAPVAIKCRWEDKRQIIGDRTGNQVMSRAQVFLPVEVVEDGLMFKGTLSDLTELQKSKPMEEIPKICIIKRIEDTPALGSTTEFLRKAFLTPWLT